LDQAKALWDPVGLWSFFRRRQVVRHWRWARPPGWLALPANRRPRPVILHDLCRPACDRTQLPRVPPKEEEWPRTV